MSPRLATTICRPGTLNESGTAGRMVRAWNVIAERTGCRAVSAVLGGWAAWPLALAMACGGLLGGYAGSRLAQRVGQSAVRKAVVLIGFGSFFWLLLRPL